MVRDKDGVVALKPADTTGLVVSAPPVTVTVTACATYDLEESCPTPSTTTV